MQMVDKINLALNTKPCAYNGPAVASLLNFSFFRKWQEAMSSSTNLRKYSAFSLRVRSCCTLLLWSSIRAELPLLLRLKRVSQGTKQ